jgi:hypothetical protein
MPFQEFAPFFGPDELDAMKAAYNDAWVQLSAGEAVLSPECGEIKNKLAQIILAAACTGKRDKERLEEAALRALLHRQSAAKLSRKERRPKPTPRARLRVQLSG